ncbi:MAG: hypothetical protein IJW83_00050 [Clostridia bacterium]|nr:hypothetical protein [Clostridia bacterium]
MARSIVEKATDALADMEFEKMHPDTLLKIIERLTVLYRGFDDTAHSERQMLKEYVDALNAYANGGADK